MDIGTLLQKPALSFEELAAVLGVAESTLEVTITRLPPRMFLIGRRRYITRAALEDWLIELEVNAPYVPRSPR
jgi:hypothetical protein